MAEISFSKVSKGVLQSEACRSKRYASELSGTSLSLEGSLQQHGSHGRSILEFYINVNKVSKSIQSSENDNGTCSLAVPGTG